MSIRNFGDKETEHFFITGRPPKKKSAWASIAKVARRKLDMVDYAVKLDDLRSPPSNRLEALKGNLKGFYSIRINDQFRVVFQWELSGPTKVRIVDYHK